MIPVFSGRSRHERRAMAQQLERDNKSWPDHLITVPDSSCPPPRAGWHQPIKVMRSRRFMVQVFEEAGGIIRLSFNRTSIDETTWRWADGITWEELQQLKAEAGYADREAVEIYPPAGHEVNVGNLRHLWLLTERLPYSWKR